MFSEWLIVAYGLAGGIATVILPKLCLCCCGFTCFGVRKYSFASQLQSNIGNVPADSLFSRFQSAGFGGYPWFINLLLFLFGFSVTVILLMVNAMGGFNKTPSNSTSDANFTTVESIFSFHTTALP